jgi:DNA polymerase
MELEYPEVIDSLEQVAAEVSGCTKCQLHHSRSKSVPGEGPADAQIMFIGEGPGFNENQSGRPFVGSAGQFLVELLAQIDLKREDVFICNVVKCRPPNNRDPQPDEIAACEDYLNRQISLINPRVIVTLGRFSMARWFPNERISHIHGKAKRVGDKMIVPMFHPAAALHKPELKQAIIDDFKKLPQYVTEALQQPPVSNYEVTEIAAPEKDEEPPDFQQLSLF